MKIVLRSKIHNARVTEANRTYVGSITVDEALLQKARIDEYEKVLVVDNDNGQRIETYVIKGPRGSGTVCINGGATHRIKKGHEIIIMAFEVTDRARPPTIVLVDEDNRFVKYFRPRAFATAAAV